MKGVSLPNAGGSSYSVGVRNYGGVEPVVLKQEPAFNPGLPLRPNPPRKRDNVNRRIPPPKLGNPIDGSANGRARGQDLKLRGQPQVPPQERAEKVKNNQASVSVQFSTSSARPTSTTRPPSTVPATSSQISTSMAKNMNNRTRSKNWNNSSSTERLFNTTTATPLHSEFNVVETEQVRYYPEGRTSPVAFNATLPDIVTVDASRTSRIPTGTSGYAEFEPKLNIS